MSIKGYASLLVGVYLLGVAAAVKTAAYLNGKNGKFRVLKSPFAVPAYLVYGLIFEAPRELIELVQEKWYCLQLHRENVRDAENRDSFKRYFQFYPQGPDTKPSQYLVTERLTHLARKIRERSVSLKARTAAGRVSWQERRQLSWAQSDFLHACRLAKALGYEVLPCVSSYLDLTSAR